MRCHQHPGLADERGELVWSGRRIRPRTAPIGSTTTVTSAARVLAGRSVLYCTTQALLRLVGAVRRLAFDHILPPSEALGRIRHAFRSYGEGASHKGAKAAVSSTTGMALLAVLAIVGPVDGRRNQMARWVDYNPGRQGGPRAHPDRPA
jgi:hypothetical protein